MFYITFVQCFENRRFTNFHYYYYCVPVHEKKKIRHTVFLCFSQEVPESPDCGSAVSAARGGETQTTWR